MAGRIALAIPVRNDKDWLGPMFASLADQSIWPQMGLWDASPDHTVQDAITPWRDRFHHIHHGPDGGQSAAINGAWRRLDGDILAWLNADDYLYPGALDLVEKAFSDHPAAEVVFAPATFVDEGGGYLQAFPAFDPDPAVLLRGCSVAQPACFVRRDAAERVGYLNENLHYAMDWDFWRRLYRAGARFHALEEPLAVMRQRAFSKTFAGGGARLRELWRVARAGQPVSGIRTWLGFLSEEARLAQHPAYYALDNFLRRTRGRGLGENLGAGRLGKEFSFSYPCYEAPQQGRLRLIFKGANAERLTFNGQALVFDQTGDEIISAPLALPQGLWNIQITLDRAGGVFGGLGWL